MPSFAYHKAASTATFAFFQNLLFSHGVALPAGVPDPHRRYEDVAILLDPGVDQVGVGDIQPDHLAEHLAGFTNRILIPKHLSQRWSILTEVISLRKRSRMFLAIRTSYDEGEQMDALPAFHIISYAEDGQKTTFHALEHVRQQQVDQQYGRSSDHFLPGLALTARTMSQLEQGAPPEAHIAVVTDFTRPTVVAASLKETTGTVSSSFSLYGLVNRFVSQFTSDRTRDCSGGIGW